MNKGHFYSSTGELYTRVSKQKAMNAYNDGKTIIIAPYKANMHFMFPLYGEFNINEYQDSFERLVNAFTYYNCCAELGNYCKYFIQESEV